MNNERMKTMNVIIPPLSIIHCQLSIVWRDSDNFKDGAFYTLNQL